MCSPAPFLSLCCLSFQAILEENKEKLPLAIDPVARPHDHVFKCVASSSACDATSSLTLLAQFWLPEQCLAQGGAQ